MEVLAGVLWAPLAVLAWILTEGVLEVLPEDASEVLVEVLTEGALEVLPEDVPKVLAEVLTEGVPKVLVETLKEGGLDILEGVLRVP